MSSLPIAELSTSTQQRSAPIPIQAGSLLHGHSYMALQDGSVFPVMPFSSSPSSPLIPSSMQSAKKERAIVQILRDIAKKYGLGIEVTSKDWIVTLTNPRTKLSERIFGYNFNINKAVAKEICDDKAATSELLERAGVPVIEHKLFLRDCNEDFVSEDGSMDEIYDYTKKYGHNVVCKPVSESSGKGVTHVTNKRGINNAVQKLFGSYPSLCISPYHQIVYEYRAIMFNGEAELVFKKIKPHLVGDGKSTVFDLFVAWSRANRARAKKVDQSTLPDEKILREGEIFDLGWKHNLCNGASAQVLSLKNKKVTSLQPASTSPPSAVMAFNPDDLKLAQIVKIAQQAVTALGITFCSVDVAEMANRDLKVMEVNAGVMMEHLIKQYGASGYQKAKSIYERVVCAMVDVEIDITEPEIDLSEIEPLDRSASSMQHSASDERTFSLSYNASVASAAAASHRYLTPPQPSSVTRSPNLSPNLTDSDGTESSSDDSEATPNSPATPTTIPATASPLMAVSLADSPLIASLPSQSMSASVSTPLQQMPLPPPVQTQPRSLSPATIGAQIANSLIAQQSRPMSPQSVLGTLLNGRTTPNQQLTRVQSSDSLVSVPIFHPSSRPTSPVIEADK